MRSSDDLTARAKIRDAALTQFAEHGVKGASMRRIAEQAGVSLALVQYHFGNKDGLRQACDEYVIEFIRLTVKRGIDEQQLPEPAFVDETHRSGSPVIRYLGRTLADATPAAAALFDELVAITREYLAERPDAHTEAAVFVAMRLSVYVLHEHLSRTLGIDALSKEGVARIGAALLEIVSPEFVGSVAHDQARTGLNRYRTGDEPR